MNSSIDLGTTHEYWSNKEGFFPDGRKLKILGVKANDGGCSYYRLIAPLQKLQELYPNVVEVRIDQNPLNWDLERGKRGVPAEDPNEQFENIRWADVVFSQNLTNFGGGYSWRVIGIAKELGKKVWYDTDDLLTDLYKGHRLEGVYKAKNLGEITTYLYKNADLVTVTQSKFADRIEKYCEGDLRVIRNAIDYKLPCWRQQRTKVKGQVRIGWAGGIHHEEDLKTFVGVPNMVNQKVGKEKLNWQYWGCPPLAPGQQPSWQHDVWKNYHKYFSYGFKGPVNYAIYTALPADRYGSMFANFDIAIAPLQMNEFNDSKSDIKVAECGRYGIPLVAADVGCYSDTIINGETGFLIPPDASRGEWVKRLTTLSKNHKLREDMGKNLKEITDKHYDLNKVVHKRLELMMELFEVGKDEE